MLVKCVLEDKSIKQFVTKDIELTIKSNNKVEGVSWCKIISYGDNYIANTYFGNKQITIKQNLFNT